MNLVDSIARTFLPAGFKIHYRIFCQPLNSTLVRMIEHVLSRMCFTYNPNGFNVVSGGSSNTLEGKSFVKKYRKLHKAAAGKGFMTTFNRVAKVYNDKLEDVQSKQRIGDLGEGYQAECSSYKELQGTVRQSLQGYEKSEEDMDTANNTYLNGGSSKRLNLIDDIKTGVHWIEGMFGKMETLHNRTGSTFSFSVFTGAGS